MGEPLVLIPGMMCDASVFHAQIRALAPDRTITIALPTRGERMEEIASELLSQLPAKFALVGLSMGGIVAMEILRRAPERVLRAAFVSCSPLADTPQQAAEREPTIVRARAGRLEEALREVMLPEYFAPGPGRIAAMNQFLEMGQALGATVFASQMRALQRRRDQQATLRKIRVPALVMCGDQDTLTPVKRHEFMAELIPNSRLAVVPDAGHLLPIERPDQTTAQLQAWLKQPYVLQ
ncbi:MAG: alpha/beta fold hydrolase [Pseudooceanicola sp.]